MIVSCIGSVLSCGTNLVMKWKLARRRHCGQRLNTSSVVACISPLRATPGRPVLGYTRSRFVSFLQRIHQSQSHAIPFSFALLAVTMQVRSYEQSRSSTGRARKSSGPNIRTEDTVRRFPPNDSRARGVSRYVRFLFCFFSFFSFLFFSSSFLSSFYVSFIFSLLIVAVSFLLFFFLFSFLFFSFYLFSFLFLFSYFILFFLYLFIFLPARCCSYLFFLGIFSFLYFVFFFFFFPNSCL